jgi:hypothetical protein
MAFIRSFMLGAMACCAAVFSLGLFIQPLSGDLTRLGELAERSWGWYHPQMIPAIQPRLATDETSILVIGDSFSDPNIWQSILEKELGRFTQNYSWDALGHFSCLKALLHRIAKQAPQITDLILEVVERDFVSRFASEPSSTACSTHQITAPGQRPATLGLIDHRPTFSLQIPDLVYAFKAAYGETLAYSQITSSGATFIAPLLTDRFFSNRRSSRLLYYSGDLQKNSWQANQMADAITKLQELSIEARSLGIRLTIAVIPDKSTVYVEHIKGPSLPIIQSSVWQQLARAGLASINVKDLYQNALLTQLDLYLPNDTHLGFNGYNLLAKAIASELQLQKLVKKPGE